jgi:uncharacterized protein (UPF0332 family)
MVDFGVYQGQGLLKKCEPDFRQIALQISRAIRDMHTLHLVIDEDPEWAATIAYQSMLRAGRAMLFSYGYLPADGQQHKTVVELTSKLLGRKYEEVTRQFDRFRKKRNVFFYESRESGNKSEALKAAETALMLINAVKENVAARNIQLDLKV